LGSDLDSTFELTHIFHPDNFGVEQDISQALRSTLETGSAVTPRRNAVIDFLRSSVTVLLSR
jgi:hypothetical protein